MYDAFTELLNTPEKRRIAERLAEIEAEDAEACSRCGGEDCICCPIYLDRQKWESPYEFFSNESHWDYFDLGMIPECEDDFWEEY